MFPKFKLLNFNRWWIGQCWNLRLYMYYPNVCYNYEYTLYPYLNSVVTTGNIVIIVCNMQVFFISVCESVLDKCCWFCLVCIWFLCCIRCSVRTMNEKILVLNLCCLRGYECGDNGGFGLISIYGLVAELLFCFGDLFL